MTELLIVDDNEALRQWAERVTGERGYRSDTAADVAEARGCLAVNGYELVLLDVNMPGQSGIDLLSDIRSQHPCTAVVMVTGEDDLELAMRAIELGAYGYVVKPVGSGELLINVANALHRRQLEIEARRLVDRLTAAAEQRGERLQAALAGLHEFEDMLWASQAETIFRLARVVEFRDEETGHHLQRMSSYCQILARRVGFSEEAADRLRLASQLHDVGKVAVPDSILFKRGRLTEKEFDVIKGHAETGYTMLAGSPSEIVQLGATIARTHHERWSGNGYPRQLLGEQIPIEGRIAAVADVFDALTSDRVYRPAFPVKSAVEMMREQRGFHFQPEMLDEFLDALPELEEVRRAYAD
jgi:putative two-component system response regulator